MYQESNGNFTVKEVVFCAYPVWLFWLAEERPKKHENSKYKLGYSKYYIGVEVIT